MFSFCYYGGDAWCIIQIEGFDAEGRPFGTAVGIPGATPEDFQYFLFSDKGEADWFLDLRGGPISRDTHAAILLTAVNVARLRELHFIHDGDLSEVLI